MGELDDTIVIFTTDNGLKRSVILRQGQASQDRKGGAFGGGYRAPCVIRWPGVSRPGTFFTEIFSALDWIATFFQSPADAAATG